MLTSSRSVSPEITSVPPVVTSDPSESQSVSSKNASHQAPLQVFEGHEDDVNCVCFYYLDENKLVTGSDDKTLRIWDRTTGAVQVLHGHTDIVRGMDVSRDGKMTVVSGSNDRTVRIWNRELGEKMHVFEGHEDSVLSMQFSADSSRVVSGSHDGTVRVWSVETGELAFEPIKCHGEVYCVRYSPSGDRIASGAKSVQIWNAETGSGIVSIRNSSVLSLAWTIDGTHVIGGCEGEVRIWNSHNGEKLRTWKVYDKWIKLSLSPTGTHVATSCWNDNTAFVFDISTGEQIAAFKHNEIVQAIAYSPSGQSIATGCKDKKVYLWEAPAVEDPQPKAPARPFSSFLDRPAIPLAEPSRNNRLDAFWDTLPNRNRQAPPRLEPQRVFNKARDTFTNVFTRRSAGATQAIPQSSVRETVEPVEVAAGRDNTFWVIVAIPTYNAVEKILYMLIHCRKPEDPDEDVPATTGANSSQTAAADTATSNQPGRPGMGDGARNTPTLAGNPVIRTQPQRTAAMRLSGESPSAGFRSSETSADSSQIRNQPESVEMIAIRETSTVSPHALPQRTPSTDPLSLVAFHEPSSTAVVTSAPLSVSSNSAPRISGRPSSHNIEVPSTETLSQEETAMIQELRRRKATSPRVTMAPESPSGSGRDPQSHISPHPPTPLPQAHGSATQLRPHNHAQPSGELDPLLLSSPLLLGHSDSLHQPSTTGDVQSPASVNNTVAQAHDGINTVSPASPATDIDHQHIILHLQEQNEQLRRQLDDAVAARRRERDGLAIGSPTVEAGPSSSQVDDLGSKSTPVASTPQAGPSASSNVPSQGHPFSSTRSISGSIEAEEQANEKRMEITLGKPTNQITDETDLQHAILQLQEQVNQLRRRVDDPKRKAAVAQRDGLDTGLSAVEAGPSPQD